MKSLLNKTIQISRVAYPFLGQYVATSTLNEKAFVVLFNREGTGMIVQTDNPADRPIGYYSENWKMTTFQALLTGSTIQLIQE